MPEELLVEIFKPFFRVEGDRSRTSGGVGLGLSIARRAVGLHCGMIPARNAGPGLVVAIELPDARGTRLGNSRLPKRRLVTAAPPHIFPIRVTRS